MKLRGNPILKKLDRYVGIPAIALLGLRPRRGRPAHPRRIGLLRTAALGDTLLLSGPLADLTARFPEADVVLITGETNAEAGALVARGRARHLAVPVARPLWAIQALRRERLDILIDSGAWPRLDAIFSALSGASFTVGFFSPGQHRHLAYDLAVRHSRGVHELENFRALLRAIDVPVGRAPSIHSGLEAADRPATGPYAVLHPWAGGYRAELKEWPSERWIELALRLRPEVEAFFVSGAKADRSRAERLVASMVARGLPARSLVGELPFEQLVVVLKAGKFVVSVNTGVMHLAAIAGAPTVVLDGPAGPERWGPVGPRAVSVTSSFPGCGFLNHGFEYDGQRVDCMLGVSVDAAVAAVYELLRAR